MKRFRSTRPLLLALAGAATIALGASSSAEAAFTEPYTTQCSGSSISSVNAGLVQTLVTRMSSEFERYDTTSPLACAEVGPVVTSNTLTSPEVLEAFGSASGVRSSVYRLGGNEEPPTLSQWLAIDLGDKPGEDSGLIRQIPDAATAVVPIVHFPAGCAIPAKEATGDGRFTVSNARLEKVYAGEITTWGALLPDIEPACANVPLKRVVPAGSEGTTFVFKQWLNTVNPSRKWPESSTLPNASWPNDSGASATIRAVGGDQQEAEAVAATSGVIGFASLPLARLNGFGTFSPENPRYEATGLFWLAVRNGAGELVQPTRDPASGADNVRGANCDHPTYNYVPSGYDTTATPIWRAISAAGSSTGWPICTLTYALAWDDASTAYGNSEPEQAQQRTVKDFLAYSLSPEGQEQAEKIDYSPLTPGVLADAQDGQSRVGWDKTPGSKEAVQAAVKAQVQTATEHASK